MPRVCSLVQMASHRIHLIAFTSLISSHLHLSPSFSLSCRFMYVNIHVCFLLQIARTLVCVLGWRVCVCVCVFVCACVKKREKERESVCLCVRERDRQRKRESKRVFVGTYTRTRARLQCGMLFAVCSVLLLCLIAVCCSVLQCIVAVCCCSVLQCIRAVHYCSASQCVVAVRCCTGQRSIAVRATTHCDNNPAQCYSTHQEEQCVVAVRCRSVLQRIVAVCHLYARGDATGWRRPIGLLKLQVIVRKRATNGRALLPKITYTDKASYGSSPPCNAAAYRSSCTLAHIRVCACVCVLRVCVCVHVCVRVCVMHVGAEIYDRVCVLCVFVCVCV